jgi:hypothetical protein
LHESLKLISDLSFVLGSHGEAVTNRFLLGFDLSLLFFLELL